MDIIQYNAMHKFVRILDNPHLNYNFECDWLIELSNNKLLDNKLSDNKLSDNKLSDNKLSDNKLSDNNLASELVENRINEFD